MLGAATGLQVACRSIDLFGVVPVPSHHLTGLVPGEAIVADDMVDQAVLAILITQL